MIERRDDEGLAASLRARLERGELPRERLTLARALGHRPAGLALGRTEPTGDESLDPPEGVGGSLEFWGRRLGRFGPAVMLRAAAAFAREVSEAAALGAAPEAAALDEGLTVIARFESGARGEEQEPLAQACERAARAVARAALALPAASAGHAACLTLLPVLRAISDLTGAVGAPDREALGAHYLRALQQAAAGPVAPERLQAAVRAALLTWALA
ncbi:MAG: hypothetical protein AB7T09_28705 [Planctomycetota bacterium]